MEQQLNIYQKMQNIRCEIQKGCVKKSGHNGFANFDYFELKDFIPSVNEQLAKNGLFSQFNIKTSVIEGGVLLEYCELIITDGDKTIKFEMPTADVNLSGAKNPIQQLGAKCTYLRRYIWMSALELTENDIVDATSGKEKVNPEQIQQDARIEQLKKVCSIEEMKELCALNGVKKIQELPKEVIRKAIEDKQNILDITKEITTF